MGSSAEHPARRSWPPRSPPRRSGGRQYATDNDGNGTVDRGYWQVNSIHGALSTYDPAGNAPAAVQLSGDGTNWSPWVTYQTGAYQGQC